MHNECICIPDSDECIIRIQSYNQALNDFANEIKEILDNNIIYNMDCINTIAEQLNKR